MIGADFAGLGETVRDSRFRSRYKAVVLSISRGGGRLNGKIGDIELRVGDALLLEASTEFVEQYRFRRDFMLVSPINDESPANFKKAPLAIGILLLMIILNAAGLVEVIVAALLAAALMLATGCLALGKIRRYIDTQVIVVIAASFALGVAMTKSGAARFHHPPRIPDQPHGDGSRRLSVDGFHPDRRADDYLDHRGVVDPYPVDLAFLTMHLDSHKWITTESVGLGAAARRIPTAFRHHAQLTHERDRWSARHFPVSGRASRYR